MRVSIKNTNWKILIWVGTFVVLGFVGLFAMYSYHTVEKEIASQFNPPSRPLWRTRRLGFDSPISCCG
jgi:L-cystine uptake protein TcyP (sodium:dicarboxylate symporter family)